MSSETITYRRAQLYEEIWAEPVRAVAKRYGVSDVALGKICRKLRIPIPGLGHWARIRVGQRIPRPSLPPLRDGQPSEIVHERWRPRKERPPTTKAEPTEPPIAVPQELHSPHKLIRETSRILRGKRLQNDRCLDIDVSKESRGRALRIMNALIRALERKGFQVEVTRRLSYDDRQAQERSGDEVFDAATRVRVDGEWIRFGITEKCSVVHTPAPEPPNHLRGSECESWFRENLARRDLVPNGTLELLIKSGEYLGARRLWHDGKRKRVEDCLNDFIAHLYVMATVLKQHREGVERARRESHEREIQRWEEERKRREEAERETRFEDKLTRWRLARDTREYVAEARALVSAAGNAIEEGSTLYESLSWYESFAARIDPLGELREDAERVKRGSGREVVPADMTEESSAR